MADDVLLNKAATIERCVKRAQEEYAVNPDGFDYDYTRQDAAILNIQRACEAALDMAQHLNRRERLGVPQSARDVFTLLAEGGWLDKSLADALKRMVGFRNIAVHDYQRLQLPITVNVITQHLDEFLAYSSALLKQDTDIYSLSHRERVRVRVRGINREVITDRIFRITGVSTVCNRSKLSPA